MKKNATMHALIESQVIELMVKTSVENVMVDDNTTLAKKLAEMVASLNGKATTEQVNQAVSSAINNLIDGAPGTYDTLKEIADYIATHQSAAEALNAAIGNKADKSTVDKIQETIQGLGSLASKNTVAETDLAPELKEKVNAAAQGNHAHGNKTVLDGITAEKIQQWDGKGRLYVSAVKPENMKEGDLWAQVT